MARYRDYPAKCKVDAFSKQAAIEDLQKMANDIRKDIQIATERRHSLEIKVAEIDQSVRSAHHRLDDLINKEG